jgi:hypothetical protein
MSQEIQFRAQYNPYIGYARLRKGYEYLVAMSVDGNDDFVWAHKSCGICAIPFKAGDVMFPLALDPRDSVESLDEGELYIATILAVHKQCALGGGQVAFPMEALKNV